MNRASTVTALHLGLALCARAISPINNRSLFTQPVLRPIVDTSFVYLPGTDWWYSHHPHIAKLNGEFVAIWSNGHRSEDKPGQRVLLSRSSDLIHWAPPVVLAAPSATDGTLNVLTAGGLFNGPSGLAAYFSSYTKSHSHTHLYEMSSDDGLSWSNAVDTGLPVTPNMEPVVLSDGRLLMADNFSFPHTDDPAGLSGWSYRSLLNDDIVRADNSQKFSAVSRMLGLHADVCEGSSYQTDDGAIHMMLRSTDSGFDGKLWESTSIDNGETWSRPEKTGFTDNDAKFNFGRLPDGRFYYVGNPDPSPRNHRKRLVLSLSTDGVNFDQHFLLGDSVYVEKHPGHAKSGQYGYPDTIISGSDLVVIVSRCKEAVEVLRVPLMQLTAAPVCRTTGSQDIDTSCKPNKP